MRHFIERSILHPSFHACTCPAQKQNKKKGKTKTKKKIEEEKEEKRKKKGKQKDSHVLRTLQQRLIVVKDPLANNRPTAPFIALHLHPVMCLGNAGRQFIQAAKVQEWGWIYRPIIQEETELPKGEVPL
jgi:hypothetical protein